MSMPCLSLGSERSLRSLSPPSVGCALVGATPTVRLEGVLR
jgi:hypothetical protein